ncbi:S-phase kinase-associated protein 2 isoform X1 [Bombyx mori]|uniref:F-box domain-containing protein n=2 Tax=Bombyx mori TaxID=7091 RepID=A0A8R2AW04_BOMMO|nr:S-phase kinase-associated protein 2 isoform X1 [Bombyx mori]
MFRYSNTDWDGIGEWSFIEMLPDEVLIAIFKYLPLDCLLVCENVSQRWKRLARDTAVWRCIYLTYSAKHDKVKESQKTLQVIGTHSECIHNLKLQYMHTYSSIRMLLEKCDNIFSLDLCMCRIEKEFERDVEKWSNLKKLSLKNCVFYPSDGDLIIQYDKFKGLNTLELPEFGLSRANCNTLLDLKNLCHIEIEKINNLGTEYIMQLILSKQNILVTFHIYGGDDVNDECLILLSKCPLLQGLSIIHCENLKDEGILALGNLKVIEQLQISNNERFSEASLLKTFGSPSMVKLNRLSLAKIKNVTPAVVDCISEYYKNLKCLALYQCPRIVNSDYEKQLRAKFRKIGVVLY